MNQEIKKRNNLYDILRIIAIFGVILIHVSAESLYSTTIDNKFLINVFANSLVHLWSVPLFIVISGALLLDNDKFNIKNMFVKYLPRIVLCLIVWHTIYYFYQFRTFNIKNIVNCFKTLITGNTYSHLWYLYLVIGLYFLTPILKKTVKNLSKKEYLYLLIGLFFISFIIPTIDLFLNTKYTILLNSFKVLNISEYIFYYLLGYYLKKYNIKSSKIMLFLSIFSIIVISIYSVKITINNNSYFSVSNSNNALSPIFIICLFCFLKEKFNSKNNKYISLLGTLTFGVYLIHFLVEKTLLRFGITPNLFNPILGVLILSLSTFIISYILSYFISKIPLINKLIK